MMPCVLYLKIRGINKEKVHLTSIMTKTTQNGWNQAKPKRTDSKCVLESVYCHAFWASAPS